MTFVDLIADARDIGDVIDLVNEFLVGLQSIGETQAHSRIGTTAKDHRCQRPPVLVEPCRGRN